MLGRRIEDPDCVEDGESAEGLGLLPVDTVLERNKVQTVYGGKISEATGVLCDIRGKELCGYEIHMGKTLPFEDVCEFTDKGTGYCSGNVYGTYVHGFFDKRDIVAFIIEKIADNRGKKMSTDSLLDYSEFKEMQYDLLARGLKESLDMEYIYRILGISDDKERAFFNCNK
jgi:cobyric acid synthase